jgi:hypothetical protein
MGTPVGKVIQTLRRKLDALAAAFTVNMEGAKDNGHLIIPQLLLSGFRSGAWCNTQ